MKSENQLVLIMEEGGMGEKDEEEKIRMLCILIRVLATWHK